MFLEIDPKESPIVLIGLLEIMEFSCFWKEAYSEHSSLKQWFDHDVALLSSPTEMRENAAKFDEIAASTFRSFVCAKFTQMDSSCATSLLIY